ncbi:MAG: hypothetical protein DRP47_06885 [Candidatus Zixiibacteriota bacterium]|nr:MAG: hypothetical protein DRP47_06885 [candidate division Zixibacteria bacterium]
MRIEEITNTSDIDKLLSIVETYSKTTEELNLSKKQFLKELGEAGNNRHIFIGFKDDVVVAMIQIILNNADNDPNLANGKDIAHLHNLQVRNELQGNGFGKQMIAFAEDKARQMGKKVLTLGVDDFNERAIDLYKKLGYEIFKESLGRFPGERCFDMKKAL